MRRKQTSSSPPSSDVGRQYGTVKDKKRKGPLERLIKKALFMPPRKTTYKFDQRYYRHITTRHGFEMPIYFCCAPSNSEWYVAIVVLSSLFVLVVSLLLLLLLMLFFCG